MWPKWKTKMNKEKMNMAGLTKVERAKRAAKKEERKEAQAVEAAKQKAQDENDAIIADEEAETRTVVTEAEAPSQEFLAEQMSELMREVKRITADNEDLREKLETIESGKPKEEQVDEVIVSGVVIGTYERSDGRVGNIYDRGSSVHT